MACQGISRAGAKLSPWSADVYSSDNDLITEGQGEGGGSSCRGLLFFLRLEAEGADCDLGCVKKLRAVDGADVAG